MRRLKTVRRPPIYPKTPGHLPCSSLTHPLPLSSRRPSVSFGGFKGKAERNLRAILGHVAQERTSAASAKATLALYLLDGVKVPKDVKDLIQSM